MTERRRPTPPTPWPLVVAALAVLVVIGVAWANGWVG